MESKVIRFAESVGAPLAVFVVCVILSFVARRVLLYSLDQWLRARGVPKGPQALSRTFGIFLNASLCAALLLIAIPWTPISQAAKGSWNHFSQLLMIVGITGVIVRGFYYAEYVINHFAVSEGDNLRQRRLRTQIQFIVKVASVLVILMGVAMALMSFRGARQLGASLIASAGLASVVIGFAAQRSLANLIAGFQIAFTQPIRIDDVLIVEKEWGRVEEITLTYVVVKLWDLRRLILPITYFVEKPFENWTRNSADILGYVFIYADYSLPVEKVREELSKIVAQSKLWDRKVCLLQVTDASEQTLQLRALVSARSASEAFDLRCFVREELLSYLQKEFPDSLPRIRAELSQAPVPTSG